MLFAKTTKYIFLYDYYPNISKKSKPVIQLHKKQHFVSLIKNEVPCNL